MVHCLELRSQESTTEHHYYLTLLQVLKVGYELEGIQSKDLVPVWTEQVVLVTVWS